MCPEQQPHSGLGWQSHRMQGPLQLVSLVTQSCLTLCDPMDCSTPGLPIHLQLPELTQIHVHRVGDAIQPSHPLSSPAAITPDASLARLFLKSPMLYFLKKKQKGGGNHMIHEALKLFSEVRTAHCVQGGCKETKRI